MAAALSFPHDSRRVLKHNLSIVENLVSDALSFPHDSRRVLKPACPRICSDARRLSLPQRLGESTEPEAGIIGAEIKKLSSPLLSTSTTNNAVISQAYVPLVSPTLTPSHEPFPRPKSGYPPPSLRWRRFDIDRSDSL